MKSLAALTVLAFSAGAAWALRGAAPDDSAATPLVSRDAAAELEAARARIRELEGLVLRLRAELGAAEDRRIEREREFLRYTQGMSQLATLAGGAAHLPTFTSPLETDKPKILEVPPAAIEVELESARTRIAADDRAREDAHREADRRRLEALRARGGDGAVPDPNASADTAPFDAAHTDPAPAERALPGIDAVTERSLAVFHALRALLAIEQVTSLDLLESGRLQGTGTGPIVLRVLDERGRPLGSISADRLRLEASRASRMVTLVLENGYERRSGAKTPFEGGTPDADGRAGLRRIVLPDCDPRPWIEALPELFPPEDVGTVIDDGRHDLEALRATLNQLLHEVKDAGGYRLRGLGGVQGDALREVTVEVLDREGRVDRRLYADRLTIAREARGILITLEGGSQIRGDRKAPFLDGRYRIYLPRADADAWARAHVPGLPAPTDEIPSAGDPATAPPPVAAPANAPPPVAAPATAPPPVAAPATEGGGAPRR